MDDNFLGIIVQVTATLMGFAFLTPLVQAISTRLFTRATAIIDERILYKRTLSFISLPVSVFFWPFLSSSLLLTFGFGKSAQIAFGLTSIMFAVVGFLWIRKILPYTGVKKRDRVIKVFEEAPRALLGVYIICATICVIVFFFRHSNFASSFIYCTDLLFVSVGVLLLLRSPMTPFEKGMAFKSSEISQMKQSELGDEKGFKVEVEEDFKRIDTALENRKKAIWQLQELPMPDLSHEGLIAKHYSEIRFLREQYQGPLDKRFEGLNEQWNKLLKKKEFVLIELFEFNDDKNKIVREYLPEFERGTDEINILLRRLAAEHKSDD